MTDGSPHSAPHVEGVYNELKRMASAFLRRERDAHTLQTTALVHEAYVRLAESSGLAIQSSTHFLAIASTVFRRVLIDHVRFAQRAKRGGKRVRINVKMEDLVDRRASVDLLVIDDCLERLSQLNERQAKVVEMRWFGGLSEEETAAALGTSRATVTREWRFARAWLARELEHLDPGPPDAPANQQDVKPSRPRGSSGPSSPPPQAEPP